jgi:HD-like signal output (HDOD) protein/ActR/RegA family two-component response regulator
MTGSAVATVLFVDDESHILSGLRRLLRRQVGDWNLIFATSGPEALAIVREQPVDAVVSDMRMPGMDGAQLLTAVQGLRPGTARIVLSGQADQSAMIAAIGAAQQFLAKPCDSEVLVGAIRRALDVRRLLRDGAVRDILGGVGSLPKPPELYDELIRATSSPDVRVADVARIVNRSLSTSAEVLRLVNSAFFGVPGDIDTVEGAVSMLGVDSIKAFVLAGSIFTSDPASQSGVDGGVLQARGLRRARLARRLAMLEELPPHDVHLVVLAALLREVGLLALATAVPERVAAISKPEAAGDDCTGFDTQRSARERAAFGCTVPEASAYLLGLWGFPDLIVHGIAAQPVAPDDAVASPAEHVLAAADRRTQRPHHPLTGVEHRYLDVARAARWNQACDQELKTEPAEETPGTE